MSVALWAQHQSRSSWASGVKRRLDAMNFVSSVRYEARTWLTFILIAALLGACADKSADGPKIELEGVLEVRNGVPVVSGDVIVKPLESWSGAVLVELVPDSDYRLRENRPAGEQRGRVIDGLVISRNHFKPLIRGGKYWIRAGRFTGQRNFGILQSLVEIPIDKRGGYLFVSDDAPNGKVIRNSYLMGEFRPFIWEAREPQPIQDDGTAVMEMSESGLMLTLEPPPGFRRVSEDRLRELRSSSSATKLAARSEILVAPPRYDANSGQRRYGDADLSVWESRDLQVVVSVKKLDEPLPYYAWDALGGQLIGANFTFVERMPLSAQWAYYQNLARLSRSTRKGILKRSSTVVRNQNVAGYPAVLTSLDLASEGGFVRAYDILAGNPLQRFALWIVGNDTPPDENQIKRLLDSIVVIGDREAALGNDLRQITGPAVESSPVRFFIPCG